MTISDYLEAYVCLILTVEFVYDYWYNSRENRIKRRKKSIEKAKEPRNEAKVSNQIDLEQKQGTPGNNQSGM